MSSESVRFLIIRCVRLSSKNAVVGGAPLGEITTLPKLLPIVTPSLFSPERFCRFYLGAFGTSLHRPTARPSTVTFVYLENSLQ